MTEIGSTGDVLSVLKRIRYQKALELTNLDAAIAALSNVEGLASVFISNIPGFSGNDLKPSVKSMMLRLLSEQDRDWSVKEIIAEYESRGTPLQAQDPNNALRAALVDTTKAGLTTRVSPGRYRSSSWDGEVVS